MKELIEIQAKLKANKSQFNAFGGYYYRSQEDILEALKPLLKEQNCFLTISDEIIQVENRIYIKATATIHNETKSISVSACAREDEAVKGMAVAQITGSSSSYARKYALNGLFAIDDNKDSDAINTHKDNILPELKEHSDAFNYAKQWILDGKGTLADVRKKYNVSESIELLLTKK